MLVTLTPNQKLRAYVYEEGYVRTCSRLFSMKTTNKFTHLTNDAVQSRSPDYGKFEMGNKISWAKFKNWLKETSNDSNYYEKFSKEVKKVCKDMMLSVQTEFKSKYNKSTSSSTNNNKKFSSSSTD